MNRKVLIIVISLGILLCGVFFAWNYVGKTNNTNSECWMLNENMNTSKVSIEGRVDTSEYPYGYNVGAIEDDKVGNAVLITPGTIIIVKNYEVRMDDIIYLSDMIHPWVSKESDGSLLKVTIASEKDNEEYVFEVGSDRKNEQIDLNRFYEQKVTITLTACNIENRDEICDWIVLKDFAISSSDYVYSNSEFYDATYVRSATYFSDEWPINFWNSEWDCLEEELNQIKDDGFESIIIVIPWREFQPEIDPVSYNEYAFDKLNILMEAAQKLDLGVYARIGYTWDFYADENEAIVDRFCRLLGEESVRSAWNAYVEKMYTVLCEYDCFRDGFLTWEDFWNTLGICDIQDEGERLKKAQYIGYQSWAQDHYNLTDYNEKYGTDFTSFEDMYVPMRTEPAMYAMYEFYDDFLMDILSDGQKVFPNLSMEVRMDWDLVYKTDGTIDYYKHTDTFDCINSTYTATMYGIPMGFENKGERVSANEAIEKTNYILQQLKLNNKNKPVFIEQFIFADNTPKFKDNAQIKQEELNTYLEKVSTVLLDQSEGYGIWTYRNYCANMIYNAQFALGDSEWEYNDKVLIGNDSEFGSNVCKLNEGGYIAQIIPSERNHFANESYIVQFDVKSIVKAGTVKISMGSCVKEVFVNQTGILSLELDVNDSFNLSIESKDCEIVIDNIKLYTQVQQGFMYDENNNELDCISGVRTLNKKLEEGIFGE